MKRIENIFISVMILFVLVSGISSAQQSQNEKQTKSKVKTTEEQKQKPKVTSPRVKQIVKNATMPIGSQLIEGFGANAKTTINSPTGAGRNRHTSKNRTFQRQFSPAQRPLSPQYNLASPPVSTGTRNRHNQSMRSPSSANRSALDRNIFPTQRPLSPKYYIPKSPPVSSGSRRNRHNQFMISPSSANRSGFDHLTSVRSPVSRNRSQDQPDSASGAVTMKRGFGNKVIPNLKQIFSKKNPQTNQIKIKFSNGGHSVVQEKKTTRSVSQRPNKPKEKMNSIFSRDSLKQPQPHNPTKKQLSPKKRITFRRNLNVKGDSQHKQNKKSSLKKQSSSLGRKGNRNEKEEKKLEADNSPPPRENIVIEEEKKVGDFERFRRKREERLAETEMIKMKEVLKPNEREVTRIRNSVMNDVEENEELMDAVINQGVIKIQDGEVEHYYVEINQTLINVDNEVKKLKSQGQLIEIKGRSHENLKKNKKMQNESIPQSPNSVKFEEEPGRDQERKGPSLRRRRSEENILGKKKIPRNGTVSRIDNENNSDEVEENTPIQEQIGVANVRNPVVIGEEEKKVKKKIKKKMRHLFKEKDKVDTTSQMQSIPETDDEQRLSTQYN